MLFPECGGDSLDHQHSFVVDYGMVGDVDLALHVHNSKVTVNLCLNEGFNGGDLLPWPPLRSSYRGACAAR
jgi:hypothetical protein